MCSSLYHHIMIFIDTMSLYYNSSNYTNNSNSSINNTSINNTNPPCFINYTNGTECYCPKDYYGPECMIPNLIKCRMDYLRNEQCPKFNEDFYVSDYDGDPPCLFVNENEMVIVKLFFYFIFI